MFAWCIPETVSGGGGIYTQVSDSKPRVQAVTLAHASSPWDERSQEEKMCFSSNHSRFCLHGSRLVFTGVVVGGE